MHYLVNMSAGGLALLVAVGGCSGSGSNQQAASQPTTSAPSSQTVVDPLANASRAPGSERLQPDEHPELAHLAQVSTDSLADAITTYVASESKGRDSGFPVPAPNGGAPLRLTLATVHRERVSRLADGRYFACADFKGADGNIYDVDIFMRAESKGLVPSDIIIHKINGAPLFNWSERDGTWSAVPVTK